MPVNRGHGQSKRWYRQCFIPISSDSSDDSDTESVIMPHTSTPTSTTREEEFSPPLLTPPPPPPPPLPPPPPNVSTREWEEFILPPPLSPPRLVSLNFTTPRPTTSTTWEEEISPPLLTPPPPPPPLLSFPPQPPPTVSTREWEEFIPPPPPPLLPLSPRRSLNFIIPQPPTSTTWDDYFPSSPPPPSPPRPCINTHEPFISMVKISELHEKDKVSNCPICMEEFKDYDQASKLPCNHTYCYECILRWINNNKTCPVCRLQLDDRELGATSLDQQPQIPVALNVQNTWDYFFPSQVSENSESGNSDESDFDTACEELGDSNANGDMVGTSQSGLA